MLVHLVTHFHREWFFAYWTLQRLYCEFVAPCLP